MTPRAVRRVALSRGRARNRRRFAALRTAGLVQQCMWVDRRLVESANQRAATLGVHRQTVFRAAVEVGLCHLRTSDVLRTAQAWRGVIGAPVAPRYPGEFTQRYPKRAS